MPEIIVIGAGISGLVAAHTLKQSGRDVLLIESSDTPGGVIRTEVIDGFLVERGPNSVRMTDELETLIESLGISDELVTGDSRAPRYVFTAGQLVRAPMGPASLVTTPLISARAKLRLLAEPFVGRPKDDREPSIEEFFSRRLGREIHDTLVSAFVSGIYAGDTARLSAEAVFPKLVRMEREHGGLARGAFAMLRARKKTAPPAGAAPVSKPKRRGMTLISFQAGLSRLPKRIGDVLGESMILNTFVEGVEREDSGFVVRTTAGDRFSAERLIIATPARAAGSLLGPIAPRAAELLAAIEYPSLASVTLAYPKDDVRHDCVGFGFLAPRAAGLRTLGAIFPSSLFPGRAPEGWHSFTCFVGGAMDPAASELDDDALVEVVADDLARAVGARGEPKVVSVTRWSRAIPQYTIGHSARIAEIENESATVGVRLLGNYLHGVSVGECVANAGSLP